MCLRQVEQSVEHINPLLVKLDELVGVLLSDLVSLEELETVAAEQDVSKAVHFQEISMQRVEPKPPDREVGIVPN